MKKIEIKNSVLDKLDMESFLEKIGCYHEYFVMKSGQEHYRLIRYLASKINTNVIEIGTHCGTSAFAMSIDTQYDIITYDIMNVKLNDFSDVKNIKFHITEFMNHAENKETILKSDMIFIDAPHNGDYELSCYNWLIENNYEGIVVWDDIHLNQPMKNFWDNVTHEKIDVTNYGHITGTGIVLFGNKVEIVLK